MNKEFLFIIEARLSKVYRSKNNGIIPDIPFHPSLYALTDHLIKHAKARETQHRYRLKSTQKENMKFTNKDLYI